MRSVSFLAFVLFFFISATAPVHAQTQTWSVTSPDESINLTISQLSNPGSITLTASKNQSTTLETTFLGMRGTTPQDDFTQQLTFVNASRTSTNHTYTLPHGKTSSYTNQANQLTLSFENQSGLSIDYIFRAYNDGIAYQYRIPDMNTPQIEVDDSSFNLPDSATLWAQNLSSNYEGRYTKSTIAQLNTKQIGFPLLAQVAPDVWTLLSEVNSNFASYTSSHLISYNSQGIFLLRPAISEPIPITIQLPFSSPWRVAVIGDLDTIIESTMAENLADEATEPDTSWIKPGKVAWSWWSNPNSPTDLQTQKEYIDFASQMGWEYILIDEGWNQNWIPELIDYANTKNVKVILWYFFGGNFSGWTPNGWVPSYDVSLATFAKLKNWGVSGAKIDFFDSDTQKTNQIKQDILKAAQDSQQLVNFHGSSFPRGERRSWPHLLTKEGVLGAEHKGQTAAHNINLTFTRNVLGPMDYTPVTFSNKGTTTNAHQLAQAVIFESAWQHFADSKETYLTQPEPVVDLLKKVPTFWDETRFIQGEPDSHIVLARRKGQDWYIAAFSKDQMAFNFPLSDLNNTNSFQATYFVDGHTADDIDTYSESLIPQTEIQFNTAAGGGAVIILTSTSQQPSCLTADINVDGIVDLGDYSILSANFFATSPSNEKVDINQDGIVDLTDYSVLSSNFLQQCH